MSRRLLLISNSTNAGSGFLDHCMEEMLGTIQDRRVLFVPYALHDVDAYADTAVERLEREGVEVTSIHRATDPLDAVQTASTVFVGGGNTFRLLDHLQRLGLVEAIRTRVAAGVPYIGTSAGTNIAAPTIMTTNDMPIVEPSTFAALSLVPFQINPHYIDRDPDSSHHGETREQRLLEFLEENDRAVVALREGALLSVVDDQMELRGVAGARIYQRGADPREISPPTRLDPLLRERR